MNGIDGICNSRGWGVRHVFVHNSINITLFADHNRPPAQSRHPTGATARCQKPYPTADIDASHCLDLSLAG